MRVAKAACVQGTLSKQTPGSGKGEVDTRANNQIVEL